MASVSNCSMDFLEVTAQLIWLPVRQSKTDNSAANRLWASLLQCHNSVILTDLGKKDDDMGSRSATVSPSPSEYLIKDDRKHLIKLIKEIGSLSFLRV